MHIVLPVRVPWQDQQDCKTFLVFSVSLLQWRRGTTSTPLWGRRCHFANCSLLLGAIPLPAQPLQHREPEPTCFLFLRYVQQQAPAPGPGAGFQEGSGIGGTMGRLQHGYRHGGCLPDWLGMGIWLSAPKMPGIRGSEAGRMHGSIFPVCFLLPDC